jgi:hypothetical protein
VPKSNTTPDVFDVFASAETTTIYLTPDRSLWVRLLNELDYGQANELENAALRGIEVTKARQGSGEDRMIVLDVNKQRLLKLALFIDDWSLPQRWPFKLDERVQLCSRLKPRWAQMIQTEIERIEAANAAAPEESAGEDADPIDQSGPTLVTALGQR